MQRILRVAAVAVLAAVAGPLFAQAQEPPKDEELQFVRQLRAKGYPDLALEYLEKRLGNNPKYAADLPLELAELRLEAGKMEPDPAKRIGIYTKVRTDLQSFLEKNAAHPRAGQAKLQIAQLAVQIGKTQLARAEALPENDETRLEEFARARALFVESADQLKKTAAALTDVEEKSKAEFEIALLLIDQARTYVTEKEVKERSKVLADACNALEKLGQKLPEKDPNRWISQAWLGRARSMNDEQRKIVDQAFAEALNGNNPTATRLVRYFQMLADQEAQEQTTTKPTKDSVQSIVDRANKWLIDNRQHQTSPEGFGVRYVLAKQLVNLSKLDPALSNQHLANCRNAIRVLEQTDNEFTAKASQIKIDILVAQGAFSRDVKSLLTFEDCYMRALFEHQQLSGKDADKLFATDEKKLAQQNLVVSVLEKAMEKQALPPKPSETELGNTFYLLAGYKLSMYQQAKEAYQKAQADVKKLEAEDKKEEAKAAKDKEAAAKKAFDDAEKAMIDLVGAGEDFLKKHPKIRQASTIALFLVRGLQLIVQDAGDDFDIRPAEREKLYQLSRMLVESFPGDKAGDLGRYYVVLYLLKKPAATPAERAAREAEALKLGGDQARFQIALEQARRKEFLETMVTLKPIKPDFPSYTIAQYQYALAALELDTDNKQRASTMQPSITLPDDKRPFKDIAIETLEKIADPPADADTDLKLIFLRAKIRLGLLLYSTFKYEQMEALVAKLKPMLERFDAGKAHEEEKKNLELQLRTVDLYSKYGKADKLYRDGKYKETADLLGPLVAALDKGEYPEVKENPKLLSGILGLALRGNLQADQHTGALGVLNVWKKLDPDKDTVTKVLQQTVISIKAQIDELRSKKEAVKLQKTADSFDAFLGQLAVGQQDPPVELKRLYAQCYLSIGKYAKAAKLLESVPEPKADADQQQQALYNVIQVTLVRALRLEGKETKNKKLLEDAEERINKLIGTPEKLGRLAKDINALKEQIEVLIDLEAFGAATNRAIKVRDILKPLLNKGRAYEEHYFDVCYMYLLAHTRYAGTLMNPVQKDEHYRKVAQFLSQLASTYPTLGGEDSAKRFSEFLYGEEGKPLRDIYDRSAKPNGAPRP